MHRHVFVATLLTAALLSIPDRTFAQTQGFTISPPVKDVTLKPGSTEQLVINVSNSTMQAQTLSLRAVDFKSLDESGGVAFLGNQNDDLTRKYSLARWLKLDRTLITVPKNGSVAVPVTIADREDLTPGGHYGAVLFRVESADPAVKNNPVTFKEVLASLLMLKKVGGESYGLELASTSKSSSWWRPPSEPALTFKNIGNVHVVPRGTVTLTDPFGRTVSKGSINQESGAILPETVRKHAVELQGMAATIVPGWYSMKVSYRYDGSEAFKTKVDRILIINVPVLAGILIGLGAISCLGVYIVRRFRRNRRSPWERS